MNAFVRNTIILIALIIIDQLLKFWVESKKFFVDLGIVAFHFISNTGASFGMLKGSNTLLVWVSIIVLGVIMINIKHIKKEHTYPVLLLISGLLGNLIDRIFRGFVVDFIDFKFWPVFNLADALIVIGVAWLLIVVLRKDFAKTKKKKKK